VRNRKCLGWHRSIPSEEIPTPNCRGKVRLRESSWFEAGQYHEALLGSTRPMYLCEFHYRKRRIRAVEKSARKTGQNEGFRPGSSSVGDFWVTRPPDQENVCEDADGGFLAKDGLYVVRRVKRPKG